MVRLFIIGLLMSVPAVADSTLTIAVASNFRVAAEEVATAFSEATSINVRISSGSTGKLYAQIFNGAPFDVFLAADEARPRRLVEQGLALAASRRTYAQGALILISTDPLLRGENCRDALEQYSDKRLALANPTTAPYGRAALEFLQVSNLESRVEERGVFGENVAQALQFVVSGNATFGLVAVSHVSGAALKETTCSWLVPQRYHRPISQQGVVLTRSRIPDIAERFMTFLASEDALEILRRNGYRLTDDV